VIDPDELRIIATETRLTRDDRAKIVEAANYFEETQRALLQAQRELIEANARRVAATERLLELILPRSWSMSSGWITLQVNA
jgi:hypothetical protein